MTTSDQPPHELRGALGNVIDPGGGLVPALVPAPLPNALANASPGLAAGAASPGIGPTVPSDDPQSMALLLGRLAQEMFTGLSIAPIPLSPNQLAVAGATASPPGSPGLTPTLLPAPPSVHGTEEHRTFPGAGNPPSVHGTEEQVRESPFTVPLAWDAVPTPGADLMRLPLFETPPSWGADEVMPAERELRLEPVIETHEVRSVDEPLVRDLGGGIFDPNQVRKDFPILEERVHGKRLVWLDNAATTQKPRQVIDRLTYFYEHENSNVHRAAHTLAARSTDAFENARETTRRFLNAPSKNEIIWVRGATEGINLVAQSWGRRHVGAGDEIVLTHLEHHANIVPWQQLCAEKGARLRIAPVDDRGVVLLDEYEKLLGPRTKLVAFTQVSNALGTITPAREMTEIAHLYGAKVLLDGAQAVSHMQVDVQLLDCDFYVFSGHKVFAPTGIGVVYGKKEILDGMPPWQGGGNMIQDVTFERTTYQPPPGRFEAGTGNIADAVGLGEALDYVMRLGMNNIDRYEHELLVYATERLHTVPGLHMIGTAPDKAGVLSFILDGQRTEDVGAALDKEGIAVRSGHHCAQPILRRFGLESSVRASLAFYNVCEDIDALVDALVRLQGGRR
jgi:cysteine desulfurase/selenocysteine lyase